MRGEETSNNEIKQGKKTELLKLKFRLKVYTELTLPRTFDCFTKFLFNCFVFRSHLLAVCKDRSTVISGLSLLRFSNAIPIFLAEYHVYRMQMIVFIWCGGTNRV